VTLDAIGAAPARFDESLATVARSLHLGLLVTLALGAAAVLYGWLERRGRVGWSVVPLARTVVAAGPYRRTEVVTARRTKAPPLVRAVAFGCLTCGHLFVPLIVVALVKYPFDGIALPLVPGLALLAFDWSCAWLLLRRSPTAFAAARAAAAASLLADAGLLVIAAVSVVQALATRAMPSRRGPCAHVGRARLTPRGVRRSAR
jgi:hypothetical protein